MKRFKRAHLHQAFVGRNLLQISVQNVKTNDCIPLVKDLVFFHILPLLLLLSPFLNSATQKKKKNSHLLRHAVTPQFLCFHPRHAVKPLTVIIRMTCFSRMRQAVLTIKSEGRSLPQHADRLTGTLVFLLCDHSNHLSQEEGISTSMQQLQQLI